MPSPVSAWTLHTFTNLDSYTSVLDTHTKISYQHVKLLANSNISCERACTVAIGQIASSKLTALDLRPLENAAVCIDAGESRITVVALADRYRIIPHRWHGDKQYVRFVVNGKVITAEDWCGECERIADHAMNLCTPLEVTCTYNPDSFYNSIPNYAAFFKIDPTPSSDVLISRPFKSLRVDDVVWNEIKRDTLRGNRKNATRQAQRTKKFKKEECTKCVLSAKLCNVSPRWCRGSISLDGINAAISELSLRKVLVYGHSRERLDNVEAIRALFPKANARNGFITIGVRSLPKNEISHSDAAANNYNGFNVVIGNNTQSTKTARYVVTFDEWLRIAGFQEPQSLQHVAEQLDWGEAPTVLTMVGLLATSYNRELLRHVSYDEVATLASTIAVQTSHYRAAQWNVAYSEHVRAAETALDWSTRNYVPLKVLQ